MIAPLCQICAITVCGVEFTNGKRPGVRSADRILADPARARGNSRAARSAAGLSISTRCGRRGRPRSRRRRVLACSPSLASVDDESAVNHQSMQSVAAPENAKQGAGRYG